MRVKICGITNVDDALLAAEAGADAIGLNFFSGSPRCISEETARRILEALPATVEAVGLFVNESWERIEEAARRLGLQAVQVHGERIEPPPRTRVRWTPAFAVKEAGRCRASGTSSRAVAADSARYDPCGCPRRRHVWRHRPDGAWDLLAGFDPGVPLMLAGGLTPDNVAAAIRKVRPYGVDTASGVESSPGKKDADKVRRFVEAAHAASVEA